MNFETIMEEAAETLRELPAFQGVPVIVESKGDSTTENKIRVAQTRIAAVIGFSGFTPNIQGETAPDGNIFGLAAFTVSIFENPTVNRSSGDRATAPGRCSTLFDLASATAIALAGASCAGMESPLFFHKISPVTTLELGGNVVITTCDVNFETKASLN